MQILLLLSLIAATLQSEEELSLNHRKRRFSWARPENRPTKPYEVKRPSRPLQITIITIGSRGDVQPFIALCKGFIADGHNCTIGILQH